MAEGTPAPCAQAAVGRGSTGSWAGNAADDSGSGASEAIHAFSFRQAASLTEARYGARNRLPAGGPRWWVRADGQRGGRQQASQLSPHPAPNPSRPRSLLPAAPSPVLPVGTRLAVTQTSSRVGVCSGTSSWSGEWRQAPTHGRRRQLPAAVVRGLSRRASSAAIFRNRLQEDAEVQHNQARGTRRGVGACGERRQRGRAAS